MEEHSDNFYTEKEDIKKNQSELRNTITEMKNTLERTKSRLYDREERISNLEETIVKTLKKIFLMRTVLRDFWNNKHTNIHILWVPEGKGQKI